MNSWSDIVEAGRNVGGPVGEIWSLGVDTVNTGDGLIKNALHIGQGLGNALDDLLSGKWFYILIALGAGFLLVDLVKK